MYKILPIINAITRDTQVVKQVIQENNFRKNCILKFLTKDF